MSSQGKVFKAYHIKKLVGVVKAGQRKSFRIQITGGATAVRSCGLRGQFQSRRVQYHVYFPPIEK